MLVYAGRGRDTNTKYGLGVPSKKSVFWVSIESGMDAVDRSTWSPEAN